MSKQHRPNVVCEQCEASFFRRPSQSAQNRRTYCSYACHNASRYTGGITPDGHRRVRDNGKNRLEHRVVVERHIGRPLLDCEVVHHVNGCPADNRIENLEVMSAREHGRIHNPLTWDLDEAVRLRAAGMPWRQIARKFGVVSGDTIKRGIKRHSAS